MRILKKKLRRELLALNLVCCANEVPYGLPLLGPFNQQEGKCRE